MLRAFASSLFVVLTLSACSQDTLGVDNDIEEVASRNVVFSEYPQGGETYLSFSQTHGFQVNYLQNNGRAWLWYPGNQMGVPERWRVDIRRNALCWTHPKNTRNPVIQSSGSSEVCESLSFARRTIIASLNGDPFRLSTGKIPHTLNRCEAPQGFNFDRVRFRCV